MIRNWLSFSGLNATINTTEDCNLRCKYCYEINKRPGNIELDKCKSFIDYLFDDPDPIGTLEDGSRDDSYDGLIIDLIGGDALMNVNILDDLLKYVNYRFNSDKSDKYKLNGWRINISSNGTLFTKPEVRKFCEKWAENLSLGVSIDGCPEIHDKNRIFKDGRGSMSTILEWWDWYKKVFPTNSNGTKATANRDSIPYLYESLKFMHETLGMSYINHNFIAEEMNLTESDLIELDHQLSLCCDYCIEHKDDLCWTMLGDRFQFPENSRITEPENWSNSSCGAGQMPALAINGDIYPCFRWLPQSQGTKTIKIGSLSEGVSKDKFHLVRTQATCENCTKDQECIDCPYESCCVWCVAGCFAEYGEFKRTTHLCEVTKLQCKWAMEYVKRLKVIQDEAS